MPNPNVNRPDRWNDDLLQFARLIAELEQADAFTGPVINKLCMEMDLGIPNLMKLIDRASVHWDREKAKTVTLDAEVSVIESAFIEYTNKRNINGQFRVRVPDLNGARIIEAPGGRTFLVQYRPDQPDNINNFVFDELHQ